MAALQEVGAVVIDGALMGQARSAGAKLAEAEKEVTGARAELHTAIRRMRLGGGSFREIAAAPGQVEQIVESAKLAEAEKKATVARAEYNAAIRRMHLSGGSFREIAAALGLSHHRVQMIVEGAGGSRSLACMFCGRPQSEVKKLAVGREVSICDGCVWQLAGVIAGMPPAGELLRLVDCRSQGRCSFCGERGDDQKLVVAAKNAGICSRCLDMNREIMEIDLGGLVSR